MPVLLQPPVQGENLFTKPLTLSEDSEDSDDPDYQPFSELLSYLIATDNSASGSLPFKKVWPKIFLVLPVFTSNRITSIGTFFAWSRFAKF
jgi:hypothetical protein